LDSEETQDKLKHRALSLASIASRYFYKGEPVMAVKACQMMTEMGPIVRQARLEAQKIEMPWRRIIQGAAQCESRRRDGSVKVTDEEDVDLPCNLVYRVLGAMTTFPLDNDDLVFEVLSNALVRRVLFVTGAVDMSGCPPADRGEAVFIGRSNVGKSSLVNMVTNRKSLAYTSKRPGKTQQFNFFTVNDKPGKEKEIRYGDKIEGKPDRDSFYIVDLPGFGFAKVPNEQRKEWADFMTEYLAKRKTLKIVFHLVDGRHGPIDEDATIMKQVGESLPKNVAYVVVLTKADKNVKGASKKKTGKVSVDVMSGLRETMRANKVGNAPVIVTSAETKLGRDDIWRYLRLAAEA
jgi:ribosome biogenesis GTP-binding protein YsxC/EngB